MTKYAPFKDWNWDREMQSQILAAIDSFAVSYANAHRKKGSKRIKVPEQMMPEYVRAAKKEAKNGKKITEEEKQNLAAFFEARNSQVKKLGGKVVKNDA